MGNVSVWKSLATDTRINTFIRVSVAYMQQIKTAMKPPETQIRLLSDDTHR